MAQSFVITNLVISLLFSGILNVLIGSIIVIQIMAHMPLADIYMPANAREKYDIMIGVVSFDFFQPTEYIDMGFTEMPFWSEQFDWLGYGTINFIDSMGSIIIFAIFEILYVVIAILIVMCGCRVTTKCLKQKFEVHTVRSSSIMFIHGTFFEILICVSISMGML